jgi:hypothetical protein
MIFHGVKWPKLGTTPGSNLPARERRQGAGGQLVIDLKAWSKWSLEGPNGGIMGRFNEDFMNFMRT